LNIIDFLINKDPFVKHHERQQIIGLPHEKPCHKTVVRNHGINELSFDTRFYQDIDTSDLIKQREVNEAQLEEIEDSIENANSLVTKTTSRRNEEDEDRPLIMRANCFSRKFKKSDIHDIKAVDKDSPSNFIKNKTVVHHKQNRYNYHKLPKKPKIVARTQDIYNYSNGAELHDEKPKETKINDQIPSRRSERWQKNKYKYFCTLSQAE
jgi:cell envelope opacity-associated protein A